MRSLRQSCRVAALAVLVTATVTTASFAQLREQPELLRRLWPFGRQQRPVPLLPAASEPAAEEERPLIAEFVPRKIDINSATLSELQRLPGVNPSMGTRMFVGRPYRNFADLERDGIPLNVVQGLRGRIIFGR